jgi:type VI secretion system secreted protein VgrG
MAGFNQETRPVRVTLGDVDPTGVLITAFSGTEKLSRLYRFTMDLVAPADAPLKFDAVLGQPAVVAIDQAAGQTRFVHGIVNRLSQGRRDNRFVFYRAELVPPLWLLTKTTRSRIFQQTPVKDILAEVIGDLYDPRFTLDATYHERNYCAQYRETDFAFLSRLMEEEGIYYYFTHTDTEHGLVIADTPRGHDPLPDDATLVYQDDNIQRPTEGRIVRWDKAQEMRTGAFIFTDHNFELPTNPLDATEKLADAAKAGTVDHQLVLGGTDKAAEVDHPAGYARWTDGIAQGGAERAGDLENLFDDNKRVAKVRMEQELVGALQIDGAGTYPRLTPGHKFTLTEHFDANGEYVVTAVTHAARCGIGDSGEAVQFEYENEFASIPAAIPFRPAWETPRPVVKGTQTAVVIGGDDDEEIDPDKYGRVKVVFRWDPAGPRGLDSSCWVRVAQFWAGKQWGAQFIPRVGDEVVVAFLEGDPDCPLIIGSVYNADNMPLYDLPKNKTQSGIKTHSSPGGDGGNYNEIKFEDKKGQELFSLHAERNMSTTVEVDSTTSVGNNSTVTVGTDPKGDPRKNGTSTHTIFGDTKVGITKGDLAVTVADGKAGVAVNKEITVDSKTSFIHVTSPTEIKFSVGKNSHITITPDKITLHSPHIKFEGTTDIIGVTPDLNLEGKDKVQVHGADVTVDGKTVGVFQSSKGDAHFYASATSKFGAGQQSGVMCDGSKVAVSAAIIESAASGNHTITGTLVKIN